MRTHHPLMMALLMVGFLATPAHAKTSEYTLTIERLPVNITGKPIEKITVNGSIPAPTLRFTEGDEAVIHVTNKMDEPTSIHWHGLLLPDAMDGVTGFGGYKAIEPGTTFTYRFP
jgi:FtsP/CotA-like multicopper oxidase with cupredoxin domain